MQLNDLVQRVKAIIQPHDIAEDDFAFMVSQESFAALEKLARQIAVSPRLRHFFLTEPTTVTLTLASDGTVDISSLLTTNRVLLDCLWYGEIFPPVNDLYPTQPFRLVENRQQGLLTGMLDSLVLKAWMEGTTLHTKSPSNNVEPLVGSISFRVPYVPTLDQVPANLEGMVVDNVVRRFRGRTPSTGQTVSQQS